MEVAVKLLNRPLKQETREWQHMLASNETLTKGSEIPGPDFKILSN